MDTVSIKMLNYFVLLDIVIIMFLTIIMVVTFISKITEQFGIQAGSLHRQN